MASNTTRLGLLKKDPLADGADTFNIKTMLNDNWDKIDSKVATLGPDGKVPAEQLNVQAPADASTSQKGIVQLSSSTTSDSELLAATPKAVKAAYDRAEAAFSQANNGKTDIASVIGSPATNGDTFAQLKTHIQNAKNKGATNLTAKGTSASGAESLESLMSKIAIVSTGKKWAGGTVTSTTSDSKRYFSITGVDFLPSIFIMYNTSQVNIRDNVTLFVYIPDMFTGATLYRGLAHVNMNVDAYSVGNIKFSNLNESSQLTLRWIAIE